MKLWNNLYDLCNERGISIYKLHGDTGISLNSLYAQANNRAEYGYYDLHAKLCIYFDVGMDSLFDVVSEGEWDRRMLILKKGK